MKTSDACKDGCLVAEARGAHCRCETECAYNDQRTEPARLQNSNQPRTECHIGKEQTPQAEGATTTKASAEIRSIRQTAPQIAGRSNGESLSVPPGIPETLADDFGDYESLFNIRRWLQAAVEAKGATFLGGGCGFGESDIDINLEGFQFHITIRPIQRSQP